MIPCCTAVFNIVVLNMNYPKPIRLIIGLCILGVAGCNHSESQSSRNMTTSGRSTEQDSKHPPQKRASENNDVASSDSTASNESKAASAGLPQSPEQVVRAYLTHFQKGNAIRAIRECWDFDALIERIFQNDLDQHNKAERAEIKRIWSRMTEQMLANPKVASIMAKIDVSDIRSEPLRDGEVAVSFAIQKPNGKTDDQVIILKHRTDEWRIVDIGGGLAPLSDSVRFQYESTGLSPLLYVRQMRQKMSSVLQKLPDQRD